MAIEAPVTHPASPTLDTRSMSLLNDTVARRGRWRLRGARTVSGSPLTLRVYTAPVRPVATRS